ncbi:MAG: hypothetical protein A2W99_09410 [Bacteroidetes bacterium GWF2_33_16]|nr:MAG: hypothetical protein A2X00_06320 [Bacteroidetes bacterium GWE2_32_14]OFY07214.1 MAG: hypothetical protein A2W99_09410 [Bacteroidetes bacterium GWF2_33_16]
MKKLSLLLLAIMFIAVTQINAQNVAITDDDTYSPQACAVLDVKSITKGLLFPRLSTTQRNAISSPQAGLVVYDTNIKKLYLYDGTGWKDASAEGIWLTNGTKLYTSNLNYRLGIGSSNPNSKLEVRADATFLDSDTLFVVKDKYGKAVFVVFPDGAQVIIDTSLAKGAVGGFAVSGRTPTKGAEPYLLVRPDSTRVYVNEGSTKGAIGGFAVSGRTPTKTTATSFMSLTPENYFIGHESGLLTTGLYNIFLGYMAGKYNIEGSRNVFIGDSAGFNNRSGGYNTYLGYQSGYKSGYATTSDPSFNTYMGYRAGYNVRTGTYNTYIGYESGYSTDASNTSGSRNTALGYGSGHSLTYGANNVFIGNLSGYSNTYGQKNVFVGDSAGYSNTYGHYNVFIGEAAGKSNTTTGYNTMIGFQAGMNSSGSNNSFFGYRAGTTNTGNYNAFYGPYAGYTNTGSSNAFMGYYAGYNNDGSYNIFLGERSGYSNQTGSQNVFIGYYSGKSNTSGAYNVFIGNNTFKNNSSGVTQNNVAIGNNCADDVTSTVQSSVIMGDNALTGMVKTSITVYRSLFLGNNAGILLDSATSVSDCVFIGTNAGEGIKNSQYNTISDIVAIGIYSGKNSNGYRNLFVGNAAGKDFRGHQNTMIGWMTGSGAGSGSYNVFIGDQTGKENIGSNNTFVGRTAGNWVTGSYNIYIGNNAGSAVYPARVTESNMLRIGSSNLITGNFSTDQVGINGNPSATTTNILRVYSGSTNGYYSSSGWTHSSDKRLKTNIETVPNALDKVLKMNGVYFNWINDPGKRQVGFIAQEMQEVLPEVISVGEDDYLTLTYDNVVPVLVNAIKEQQQQIDAQQKQIELLIKEIESLKEK